MEIFEIDEREAGQVDGLEVAETTGQTAADEYEGTNENVRSFLSAFEV